MSTWKYCTPKIESGWQIEHFRTRRADGSIAAPPCPAPPSQLATDQQFCPSVPFFCQFSHQSLTFLPFFSFRPAFISFCWLEAAKAARWSSLGDLWPTLPPDIRLCNLGDGPWCFHRGFWHRYHAEGVIINILCNRLFYAVEADIPPIGFNRINDSWPNQYTDNPFDKYLTEIFSPNLWPVFQLSHTYLLPPKLQRRGIVF